MNKLVKTAAVALGAASSAFAAGEGLITGYAVSQHSYTRVVTAEFTLTEPAIVMVDVRTNQVSIGRENFASLRDSLSNDDRFPGNRSLKAGLHRFIWRATGDWPDHEFASALSVDVRAYRLANPPDYMVVALKDLPDEGLARGDRRFYEKADDMPGWSTRPTDPADTVALDADPYRTAKMIFRRIPAAGVKWRMGAAQGDSDPSGMRIPHYVTLSNDYYMAVYMATRAQVNNITGGTNPTSSIDSRVMVSVSYTAVRGDPTDARYCWPETDAVEPNYSWSGRFGAFSGLKMDLATEAQWEFACRAGCGENYYWGSDGSLLSDYEWTRESANSDYKRVGLKKPNGFGLYDMCGNVMEWVRDQYSAFGTNPVEEPKGPMGTPSSRVLRCGSVFSSAGYAVVAYRYSGTASSGSGTAGGAQNYFGFRFSCPAVIPAPAE